MKKKLSERFALNLRKNWITSDAKTFLLVAILLVAYITLNLWIEKKDIEDIDITKNKIYSLSEESKIELDKVNKPIKVFVYGYAEDSSVVDLLKKYNHYNANVSYEMLTEETNPGKIKDYALEAGNQALIFESGEKNQIVYNSEFFDYDMSYQQIDLTENKITNTVLNLTIANKPKLYVLKGHNEFSIAESLNFLMGNLQNEVFEYSELNLLTSVDVPSDCDLLMILTPRQDLSETEANVILNYINNGGNIFFTSDLISEKKPDTPNLQKILDVYGVNIDNGIVYELDENHFMKMRDQQTGEIQSLNTYVIPTVLNSSVTKNIKSSANNMGLPNPQRIKFDEEHLNEIKVEVEPLLNSSEKALFISDFSKDITNAADGISNEVSTISAKFTKTLDSQTEDGKEKVSKMFVLADGVALTDENIQGSYFPQNISFAMSAVADLTGREDTVTVRKQTESYRYSSTPNQSKVVLAIIVLVPLAIIILGIIVWNYRKHKR